MLTEDLTVFLADFGVTAEVGSTCAKVLLDMPDENVLGDRAQSRNYRITYVAADLPDLARGDAITVNGVAYQVRSPPMLTDDGVFQIADLQRP